jgi:hypothetical protein
VVNRQRAEGGLKVTVSQVLGSDNEQADGDHRRFEEVPKSDKFNKIDKLNEFNKSDGSDGSNKR